MNPKTLSKAWLEPDSARLSKKQIAIRLPLRVIAGVNAIEVLFPKKNKTEIIGDLLSAALDQFAEGLPDVEPDEGEKAEAREAGTNAMSQRRAYEFMAGARLRYLEDRETGGRRHAGVVKPWVQFQLVDKARAPRQRGAGHATTEARPAKGARGDQGSRKRGGGGRRAKG